MNMQWTGTIHCASKIDYITFVHVSTDSLVRVVKARQWAWGYPSFRTRGQGEYRPRAGSRKFETKTGGVLISTLVGVHTPSILGRRNPKAA